jgi:hypothetical protein
MSVVVAVLMAVVLVVFPGGVLMRLMLTSDRCCLYVGAQNPDCSPSCKN